MKTFMRIPWLLVVAVVALLAQLAFAQTDDLYRDLNSEFKDYIKQRYPRRSDGSVDIEALVASMTLEEKAAQLDQIYGTNVLISNGQLNDTKVDEVCSSHGCGVIHDLYPPGNLNMVNRLVNYTLFNTTSAIPILFVEECLHGGAGNEKTVFPTPLTSAASFDVNLLNNIGKVIARETRAYAIVQCFAPVIGVAREPRWGRVEETYGEDVYLTSQLAKAMVLGLQGGPNGSYLSLNTSVVAEPKHFAAHSIPENGINTSPVHLGLRELFEVFLETFRVAVMEGGARGIMCAYSEIDGIPMCSNEGLLTKVLREEWGFKGWVLGDDGAIRMMMDTHHIAATPSEAIGYFLRAGGNVQYYDFPDDLWRESVIQLVTDGHLDLATLDLRVTELLNVKQELGLFENPYWHPQTAIDNVNTAENQAVALLAAQEAMILLENDGTLPINTQTVKNIAVIGPNADIMQMGDYAWGGINENSVTNLQGITTLANNYGINVQYAEGSGITNLQELHPIHRSHYVNGAQGYYYSSLDCSGEAYMVKNDVEIFQAYYSYGPAAYLPNLWNITAAIPAQFSVNWTGTIIAPTTAMGLIFVDAGGDPVQLMIDGQILIDIWPAGGTSAPVSFNFTAGQQYSFQILYARVYQDGVTFEWNFLDPNNYASAYNQAVALAAQSDLAIVIVGEDNTQVGEGYDREFMGLPLPLNASDYSQEQLVQAIQATGTKVVVVLVHGRPLSIPWIQANVNAIVDAGFAGQCQGQALADVLFGLYNPAGRIPMSYPIESAQLPVFYNYKPSSRGHNYVDGSIAALWSFGYGKSYTTFEYSNLTIDPLTPMIVDNVTITFNIENTGNYDGDEVPQLYIRDDYSSVTTVIKQLKSFTRINIPKGQTVQVTFTLNVQNDLWLINRDYEKVVEPGLFLVMVGASSDNILLNGSFFVINGSSRDESAL